jgi:hypothetical protein
MAGTWVFEDVRNAPLSIFLLQVCGETVQRPVTFSGLEAKMLTMPTAYPGPTHAVPFGSSLELSHLCLMMQIAITLVLTRVLGKLLGYLRQPQVVGEIIAGVFAAAANPA